VAIASEHGGVAAFRRGRDYWDVFIVRVEIVRDRPPYHSEVCIDVGGTIHLVPETRFREIFEESRRFRPLLSPGGVYEGMTMRRELEEIADQTGGAVGYRRWLGEDRFEPVLVLILRYFDEEFLDLQLGRVRLRLREADFDRAVDAARHEPN
jgi:hypothetical protein